VALQTDVLVAGAGPAGIAAAIAASRMGLRVTVADYRKPPIDKTCGEGLLPEAVAALENLGVPIDSSSAFPFSGIRFSDDSSTASARFSRGSALGLRRTLLHTRLIERATELGVSFLWGSRITGLDARGLFLNGSLVPSRWIVGADGQNSTVRKLAGLDAGRQSSRFGFRQHFSVAPWTSFVEVHWGDRRQMIVTPTNRDEICLALLCSDPRSRIEQALAQFPEIARHLRGARPTSVESGAVTGLSRAQTVARGNIALIGDASCTIDGIAGQGLCLALQQAAPLAEALACGDLARYKTAHRRLTTMPVRMTRLMLLLDRSEWIRRKTLRLFEAKPHLFSKVMSVHAGQSDLQNFKAREVIGLGWDVLRA
jgi:2-polyprenyl-6-methoxyphenol hydroxylase-like FAD-dependent oxidoreductase